MAETYAVSEERTTTRRRNCENSYFVLNWKVRFKLRLSCEIKNQVQDFLVHRFENPCASKDVTKQQSTCTTRACALLLVVYL